ncbi:heterokaryon incompatibility protein-domain-containing protein [Nemania diffusa]|nr:heterokaryon incompatibility protein-domain-containing protein [Nemania diffusa]
MRLLNIDSLEVEEFIGSSLPPYTILSHTWGLEEVTLQDLPKFGLTRLVGFRKLQYLCDQTRQDGFQYTWVDTCCIDRESSAELSEAINSMYKWYSKAEVCYVYLCDVHYTEGEDIDPTSAFYHSRWFARSWTLQELIAPDSLTFYDAYWRCIGTKKSLFHIVSAVTGIPQLCLEGKEVPADFSVATRFSWASKRSCTRPEDIAYSLMGLFGVYMPLLYGEGEKAFFRLQEEIVKSIDDQSIFSWAVSNEDSRCGKPSSIFARSPADFATAANIYPFAELQTPPYFTSRGLSISLPLVIASKSFISSLSRDCELDDLLSSAESVPRLEYYRFQLHQERVCA